MGKHKMTKATEIPIRVKKRVWNRDGGLCVLCGMVGNPDAHYISRAHGGKGIEENIITLCPYCHRKYDGTERNKLKPLLADYLKVRYKNWNENDLIYHKWTGRNEIDK